MDIQAQVAARRAERERQARQAHADAQALNEQRAAEERRQREVALEEIAAELSTDDVTISRDGDSLTLTPSHAPEPLDVRGMKKAQIEQLFQREARKAWTPGENWMAIAPITAGAVLIFIPWVGVPLLIFGFWRMSVANKKHQDLVRARYADLTEHHRAASL